MVKDHFFAGEKMTASPLIIAHRGASFDAPENTLAAFRLAVEAGAEGVEFDVQLSRDGVPMVIHDPTLERTGSRLVRVADLTSDRLREVDVGTWFNIKHPKRAVEDYANETIPTLAQVSDQLSSFKGLIYIELKATGHDHQQLASAVCDAIRSSPLLPQMIVKSFKLAVIPEVRCLLPEASTAALFAPQIMSFLKKRRQIVEIAHEFGANQISVHRSMLTRGLMKRAYEAHMPVTIWTADKPLWLTRCRKLGVKALITNKPASMLRARNELDEPRVNLAS
jgi:glycerophosphoryl diester phosphodiesterase